MDEESDDSFENLAKAKNYDHCIVKNHDDSDSFSDFSLDLNDCCSSQTSSNESNDEDVEVDASVSIKETYVIIVGLLEKFEKFLNGEYPDIDKGALQLQVEVTKKVMVANCRYFGYKQVVNIGGKLYVNSDDELINNENSNLTKNKSNQTIKTNSNSSKSGSNSRCNENIQTSLKKSSLCITGSSDAYTEDKSKKRERLHSYLSILHSKINTPNKSQADYAASIDNAMNSLLKQELKKVNSSFKKFLLNNCDEKNNNTTTVEAEMNMDPCYDESQDKTLTSDKQTKVNGIQDNKCDDDNDDANSYNSQHIKLLQDFHLSSDGTIKNNLIDKKVSVSPVKKKNKNSSIVNDKTAQNDRDVNSLSENNKKGSISPVKNKKNTSQIGQGTNQLAGALPIVLLQKHNFGTDVKNLNKSDTTLDKNKLVIERKTKSQVKTMRNKKNKSHDKSVTNESSEDCLDTSITLRNRTIPKSPVKKIITKRCSSPLSNTMCGQSSKRKKTNSDEDKMSRSMPLRPRVTEISEIDLYDLGFSPRRNLIRQRIANALGKSRAKTEIKLSKSLPTFKGKTKNKKKFSDITLKGSLSSTSSLIEDTSSPLISKRRKLYSPEEYLNVTLPQILPK